LVLPKNIAGLYHWSVYVPLPPFIEVNFAFFSLTLPGNEFEGTKAQGATLAQGTPS